MILPTRAVVLLCLLLAADSEAANKFTEAGLVPVKSLDQLWRYQVGHSAGLEGVTPGDDYICLRDWNGKFIRGGSKGPYAAREYCRSEERFVVKVLGHNLVSIQRWRGNFIRCNKPDAGASASLVQTAKFILYTNDYEDRLYLYNPYYHSAIGSGSSMFLLACSRPSPDASVTFYGWKRGPKDAWNVTDEWVRVGKFDNRNSSSIATFKYFKTVGTERLPITALGAGVSIKATVGPLFGEFFSKAVQTTIKADWSEESRATWSAPTTTEDSIEVPPGVATAVYQAVGTYGVFLVKSNYFRAEDFNSEGSVDQYQRPLMVAT